jgi:hypothetical protein
LDDHPEPVQRARESARDERLVSRKALYRTAAVLLVLFAGGHQLGFRQVDPSWSAGQVVTLMQSTHFTVQGFSRSYWEFFSGFGFFSTVFLLFSALLAWELARVPREVMGAMTRIRWAFALCYLIIAVLMWTNFFAGPIVFSVLIALCLLLAAWKSEVV